MPTLFPGLDELLVAEPEQDNRQTLFPGLSEVLGEPEPEPQPPKEPVKPAIPPTPTGREFAEYDQDQYGFEPPPRVPPVIPIKNQLWGTVSSEETISVEEEGLNDGAITVIPTIWAGERLDPAEARRRAIASGLHFPSFSSHKEADEFAKRRSETGGAVAHGFLGTPRQATERDIRHSMEWQRELAVALQATEDEAFLNAPDDLKRLDRLNEIRQAANLPMEVVLPDEFRDKGFLGNLVQAVESGLAQTAGGLLTTILSRQAPLPSPKGKGFQILSEIVSLAADPVTYLGFGAGGLVGKQVIKKAGQKFLGRMAGRATTFGVGLPAITAVREPLGQLAATGQIRPEQTLKEVAKAAPLGIAAGAAGAVPYAGLPLEIGAFAAGGAALERRKPTVDDFVHAAGVILGLRVVGGVTRIGQAIWKRSQGKPLEPAEEEALKTVPEEKQQAIVAEVAKTSEQAEILAELPRGDAVVGVVAMNDVLRQMQGGANAARAFLQRFLTSRGELPDPAFRLQLHRDAKVMRHVRQAVMTLRDFDRATKTVYGDRKSIAPEQVQQLDRVLKGEAVTETIPEPMRPVIATMRSEIDALSQAIVDVGAAQGPLVATIGKNLGVYATRSYRVHDDPKWATSVPLGIRNKAKAWLRSEYPGKTEDQVEALIEHLLIEGKAADSPIAILARGRILGEKDVSILRKLKDLPIELRLLWGEHKDARVNYSRSILKMAHLVENQRFLNEVRDAGMGRFFFDEPTVRGGEPFVTRITTEPYRALAPLDGLYTSVSIKHAFERAMVPAQLGSVMRGYMKVNSVVKYTKTVLSLMTHIRNLLGNTAFAVTHGHWQAWNAYPAIRGALASLGKLDAAQWRKQYLRMVELGVVHQSARAGELQDVIRDASKVQVDQFLDKNADKLARRLGRGATELYRAEDDVWKIFGFLNEKARYQKRFPKWTTEQVEQRAAEIVRNAYPTYSMIPEGVRMLRRFPLVGTFVSFPAEVGRTAYKTLRLIQEELADPRTRDLAYMRIAGSLVAATGTAAIAAASRAILGVTREHDEGKRAFLPPWSQNSQLLHLGENEEGLQRYIDMSYVDPYEYLKKPLTAFLRGDDWQARIWESMVQAGRPFFSEEILAAKLLDVARNKKPTGGRVYNPEEHFEKQLQDRLLHLYPAIEPGTASRARKFVKGVRGESSPYGRRYDPELEALAEFTGQRIVTLDVQQGLAFKARAIVRQLGNISAIVGTVAHRAGTVKPEDIQDAYRRSEVARARAIAEASRVYHSAIRLDISTSEVFAAYNKSLSREVVHEIVTGTPNKDAWLSNLLYAATTPSATSETRDRASRAALALGATFDYALPLLSREYKWRTLKRNQSVPYPGRPTTAAFRNRIGQLRKLLQKETR